MTGSTPPERSRTTERRAASRATRVDSVSVLTCRPAFLLSAVLILGLGIGINTAVFTLVRAVLLNPLPFPDADELVMIWKATLPTADGRDGVAPRDYFELEERVSSASDVAAYFSSNLDVAGVLASERTAKRMSRTAESSQRHTSMSIVSSTFSVTGGRPVPGRRHAEGGRAGRHSRFGDATPWMCSLGPSSASC